MKLSQKCLFLKMFLAIRVIKRDLWLYLLYFPKGNIFPPWTLPLQMWPLLTFWTSSSSTHLQRVGSFSTEWLTDNLLHLLSEVFTPLHTKKMPLLNLQTWQIWTDNQYSNMQAILRGDREENSNLSYARGFERCVCYFSKKTRPFPWHWR